MPELPEVEVTRQRLSPRLCGRAIVGVKTTRPSYFFLTPPDRLKRGLLGATVSRLDRHGKYLVATLSNDKRLLLHLGMTGQLFTSEVSSPRLLSSTAGGTLSPEAQSDFVSDKHTHLRLRFDDGPPDVVFRDMRKFGKVRLLGAGESDPRLDKLGKDALTVEGPELFAAARRRATPIKTLLLDQSVVAGIGNIYADEALFLAGVRPTRGAKRVSAKECGAIASATRRVMVRSIETGGSSISDYVAPDGSDGGYQDERRVYSRTGQPCYTCGSAISRVVVGQRSSHFCRNCQR